MEEQLLKLVGRIEASSLPVEDKNALYQKISEGLRLIVWPILASNMPADQLETLAAANGKASVEAYATFVSDTLSDEVLSEVNVAVKQVLSDIDSTLTQGGVA
ncbi:hypothetical protein HY087_02835 [Candidatus Gottesmanbacteria bacterium]|nr:hypothetical protein [Candidatus Gottesmanbacteria bacterium]